MPDDVILFIIMSQFHKYRESFYNEFVKILTENSDKEENWIKKKSKIAEIGLFNNCLDYALLHKIALNWNDDRFVNVYKIKALHLLNNINPKSYVKNTQLMKRFVDEEFMPQELAYMSKEKLFPEHWQELIAKRELHEYMLAHPVISEPQTDMFKCPRCKQRKTIHQEVQTRSADEPMTSFITCINCNHKWRQS